MKNYIYLLFGKKKNSEIKMGNTTSASLSSSQKLICGAYLKNVKIHVVNVDKTLDQAESRIVRQRIFSQFSCISDDCNSNRPLLTTFDTVTNQIPQCSSYCEKWVLCRLISSACPEIQKLMMHEISSTAYMLRVLVNAVLPEPPKSSQQQKQQQRQCAQITTASEPICTFTIAATNVGNITGVWANDSQYIDMQFPESTRNTPKRFILASGPSSAGKTHLSTILVELLYPDQPPPPFFSIDGGRYRELSVLYRRLVQVIKHKGYAGFSDLIVGTVENLSLFQSSLVKTQVQDYLVHQQNKYNYTYNIYVPETKITDAKLTLYTTLSRDTNYTSMLIYQHCYGTECPFSDSYKCNGTTASGTSREKQQGKKYSNLAYYDSMSVGIQYLCTGGPAFIVHNTGRRDRISILWDLKGTLTNQDLLSKNILYIKGGGPLPSNIVETGKSISQTVRLTPKTPTTCPKKRFTNPFAKKQHPSTLQTQQIEL